MEIYLLRSGRQKKRLLVSYSSLLSPVSCLLSRVSSLLSPVPRAPLVSSGSSAGGIGRHRGIGVPGCISSVVVSGALVVLSPPCCGSSWAFMSLASGSWLPLALAWHLLALLCSEPCSSPADRWGRAGLEQNGRAHDTGFPGRHSPREPGRTNLCEVCATYRAQRGASLHMADVSRRCPQIPLPNSLRRNDGPLLLLPLLSSSSLPGALACGILERLA